METLQICQILLSMMANQPLSIKDHQAIEQGFYQVAPDCKKALEEAKKKAEKK